MIVKRIVGPKGQVVIPKDVRDALGLREGSEVVVELRGDEVVIKRAKPEYEEERWRTSTQMSSSTR
ncbi:MAG: AbrB/MazE/SpoVT family DNA-binding domain-containing protein [Candidatus Freyarchaeota archaeon]